LLTGNPCLGPTPLEYSFAPPGARSLAMGASFIGIGTQVFTDQVGSPSFLSFV
jgi:hypothetical protein